MLNESFTSQLGKSTPTFLVRVTTTSLVRTLPLRRRYRFFKVVLTPRITGVEAVPGWCVRVRLKVPEKDQLRDSN